MTRYRTINRIVNAGRRLRRQRELLRAYLDYYDYRLRSRFGPRLSIATNASAVFVMPTYSPRRARNIEPIARTALRCDFISQVVISNHNPALRLADWVHVRDPRLHLIDQPVRRGSGYRWVVARDFPSEFYISLDDDVYVGPEQLQLLFERLVHRPEVPHGIAGRRAGVNQNRTETSVDVLYNLFGATDRHVQTYFERIERLAGVDAQLPAIVERCCDDIVLSNTGSAQAVIHNAGRLRRCPTFDSGGVALHREDYFLACRYTTWRGMKQLGYCAADVEESQ